MTMSEADDTKYRCRVCGLLCPEPPWGEDGNSPDFSICVCCGAEAGYEDCIPKAARAYRERWVSGGAKWIDDQYRPKEWSLEEQLAHVPKEFL
jgi:hypothetical protein